MDSRGHYAQASILQCYRIVPSSIQILSPQYLRSLIEINRLRCIVSKAKYLQNLPTVTQQILFLNFEI